MAKTNTGGGSYSGSSSPPGGNGGSEFYGGSEPITVNTEGMRRGGLGYRGVGDGFRGFAQHHEQLLNYEPLVNGESDETWDKFSPGYKQGSQKFVDGVHKLAKAAYAVADGVAQMAAGYEKTEENAIELGRNALFLQGPPPGSNGGNGNGPGAPARRMNALAPMRRSEKAVPAATVKFVDQHGNPTDPDIRIPEVPKVVTNSAGEPVGILAPAGTSLRDNGRRTVFMGKDGEEKGFFQPLRGHAFDEVPRSELQPVTTVMKFVDPQGEPADPDFGIPEVPQVLVNARGEEIGVLAPAGTALEDNGNRTVFVGRDGTEKGFFQPFGDHTFDEAQRGELRPAVRLLPMATEVGIPEVPQILTNADGEEIGLLAPAGTPFEETDDRQVLRDDQGREIGFFQPFGDHTLDEAQPGLARRPTLPRGSD